MTGNKAIARSWRRRAVLVASLLLLAASAWLHIVLPAQEDKGWLLHAARMWLEGQQLYVDVVEVNPPLILWIYALPVWLSQHIPGLADYEALAILGLFCCACTAVIGARLIRWHPAFAGNGFFQAKFALLLCLIFVFYTTQLYFFDRDHIFFVMTFPYLLRFMPSLTDQKLPLRLRVVIGCMAAIGFCMKPHTVIVFAAIQGFTLLRTRSFASVLCVENFLIVGLGFCYLLGALYFAPDYFRVVLLVAFATYSEFGNFGGAYIYLTPVFVSLGLAFANFRTYYATPYRRDVYYFAGTCLAFLAYALANNGWGYTYNPLYCITIFTTLWMMWEYMWLENQHVMHHSPAFRAAFGVRGCILVLCIHSGYALMYILAMIVKLPALQMDCGENNSCWEGQGEFVNYVRDNHIHSFGALSLDFSRWALLVHLPGVRWEARFNHLWMLPKLVHGGEEYIASHRWILDYVGKSLADHLERRKPEIMFVDTSPGFMGGIRRFDYAVLLSHVTQFKEAWRHYHYSRTIDICSLPAYGRTAYHIPLECRYDVYIRMP